MRVFLPVMATIFLWWFTTGLVMVVYGRGKAVKRAFFIASSVMLVAALGGVVATRGTAEPWAVYAAVTCSVLAWGWQVGSYYLGFVTGPGVLPEQPEALNMADRFRAALGFSLYHELLALGFGAVLAVVTWGHPNRWAFWIYAAVWAMHASAKLNVFFGVRNFRMDLLPENFRKMEGLLGQRPHNELFPFSVLAGTTAAVLAFYFAIVPGATPSETVGFLLVGTMIGLGVIEHWMLVLPIPAMVWGWGLQPVTAEGDLRTLEAASHAPVHMVRPKPRSVKAKRVKRVLTYEREHGPLVVDIWEPDSPSGHAPVLLVHGWGGTGSYWHNTAFALSENVRVIVPDLPGTGRSQPVSRTMDMFDQVAALQFVMDELIGEGPVQVVGHSMGGAMSVLLTDANPQQVERLVLTSLCFFMNKGQERLFAASMLMFKATMGLRKEWLAEVPGMPQLMALQYFYRVPDDHEVLHQGLLDYLRLDAGTTVACADDATDPRIPEAGARLNAPTLLIACKQDRVMPTQNVDFTAETIPDCRVAWMDKCGHLPMVEKPDEYNTLLTDFLSVGQAL